MTASHDFDSDAEGGSAVSRRHWAMLKAGADTCLGFGAAEGAASLTRMARVAGVSTYESAAATVWAAR